MSTDRYHQLTAAIGEAVTERLKVTDQLIGLHFEAAAEVMRDVLPDAALVRCGSSTNQYGNGEMALEAAWSADGTLLGEEGDEDFDDLIEEVSDTGHLHAIADYTGDTGLDTYERHTTHHFAIPPIGPLLTTWVAPERETS